MKQDVVSCLSFLGVDRGDLYDLLEKPKNEKMGDYSLPCFFLSQKLKKSPIEVAKQVASDIKVGKSIEKVEAVGPYVNFFLKGDKLAGETIDRVLKEGDKYGNVKISKDKVMIEFSQPNTHKAFHIGHVRGTSLGESISRLSEFCGNETIRANYMGDTGMHVAKWIWFYTRYLKSKKLSGKESEIAEIYVNAVKKLGKNEKYQKEVDEINRKLDDGKDKELLRLWKETRKASLDAFEKIYSELNVRFDEYFFESEVEKRGKELANGLVKKGIAEVSDGAVIVDLKKYGLSVWVLLRNDGTVLYSAKDIALAERKFKDFGIDRSIYVVGTAQKLHFYQLFKTLELMKFKQASKCEYVPVTEVRFPWGKMSSRTGENVLYSDFKEKLVRIALKEVEKRYEDLNASEAYDRALAIAISALKYGMLKQDVNKVLIFDPKEALSFEGNTGSYLLYSYARAKSILRKAGYKKAKKFEIPGVNEHEKRLVVKINEFPEVVKQAYSGLSPNLIANYAYDLAKAFNEFYHHVKVVGSGNGEQFRLKLVDSFSQTLHNTLYLLGINTIEEM